MKKQNSKNEERFRNLQDIFKHSNIWIIGVPEGEEQEQEIENLFEQIMKENSPNLAKEIDFREAQRVPKKLDPRNHTPRRIITTLTKIKDTGRILKVAREKKKSYLQRSFHKTISWFLKGRFAGKKGQARSIQSDEKQWHKT